MTRYRTRLLAGFFCFLLTCNGFSASSISWDMESFEPDMKNIPSLSKWVQTYNELLPRLPQSKVSGYERTLNDLLIPHDLLEEFDF